MDDRKFEGNAFPEVFCIESIRCTPGKAGGYDCRAMLYHDRASITVSFKVVQRDPHLKKGRLVSVAWRPVISSDHGAVKIDGLVMRDAAVSGFNPFQSVPHTWCVDRHQVECARDLWDASSKQLRKLLFTTFWSGLRARRSVPSGRTMNNG